MLKVDEDGRIKRKKKGILTGSPISPLFANMYLAPLDAACKEKGFNYCRFADDIAVFCKSFSEAEAAFDYINNTLEESFGLSINTKKSGVRKAYQDTYLGYQFEFNAKNEIVTVVKERKESQTVYRSWKREGVQLVDRNYHLINDGILTRKDYTLLFDNEDGKRYLPVETTESISIYSNVIIASDVLKFLSDKNIYLSVVNKYGDIVGHFCGQGAAARSRTMVKQMSVYLDDKRRLELARKMERAFIHNIKANLKYYCRRSKSEAIAAWLEKSKEIDDEINRAKDINNLLAIEARCRQEYYQLFNEIISQPGFAFVNRTRRPPMDALNAMISFGNTLLYNRVATEINKTSLDIRVGIVHSTNNRSQTLNLDIADIFKPILVDRTIFTLINRRVINPRRDFVVNSDGSVYLSNIGKRIFISEFNSKMHQKITDRGKSISYEVKIRQEISKLYRFYVKDEKYKPYNYTN